MIKSKTTRQTEYGNQGNFSYANKSINDTSFVSSECTNPNGFSALDINNAPGLSNNSFKSRRNDEHY